MDDDVPIEEWASEFFLTSSLTKQSWEGVVKASPNRAIQKTVKDPKPGELTMSRLNVGEI